MPFPSSPGLSVRGADASSRVRLDADGVTGGVHTATMAACPRPAGGAVVNAEARLARVEALVDDLARQVAQLAQGSELTGLSPRVALLEVEVAKSMGAWNAVTEVVEALRSRGSSTELELEKAAQSVSSLVEAVAELKIHGESVEDALDRATRYSDSVTEVVNDLRFRSSATDLDLEKAAGCWNLVLSDLGDLRRSCAEMELELQKALHEQDSDRQVVDRLRKTVVGAEDIDGHGPALQAVTSAQLRKSMFGDVNVAFKYNHRPDNASEPGETSDSSASSAREDEVN